MTTEPDTEEPVNPNIRTEADVAADPRPLGWLFDLNGSRYTHG